MSVGAAMQKVGVTYSGPGDVIDAFSDFEDWFEDAADDGVFVFSGDTFKTAVTRQNIVFYTIEVATVKVNK
jgi:hypothetical protein